LDEENKLLEKFKKEHIKLQEQIKELQEQKKQIKSSVKSLDLHAKVAKSELDNIDTKITYLREVIKYDKDLVSDIKELLEQYEESDLDGTVHELIRRINMTETINKQDYKLEVSEMLSRFNERTSKIKNTNIEKSDKIIKIDNTISSVSHKKAYTNKLPTN
ncbi:MAG: hypothetical protein GQ474_08905, partial [Sulfurimonas sp.]|nr:hypothetical protein [Sulfurimonas sp.]